MAANLIKSVSVNYFRYGSGRFILFLYIHFELYIQFYFYSNVQSHRAVARVRESIFARTTSAPCRAVCTDKKKEHHQTECKYKIQQHRQPTAQIILSSCGFCESHFIDVFFCTSLRLAPLRPIDGSAMQPNVLNYLA